MSNPEAADRRDNFIKMALFVRSITLLLVLGALGVLAACTGRPTAPQNPLHGDWSMELPTTPRMHGNEIAFHPDCVIASGNLVDSRVVQPARFLTQDRATYVWYGAATESPRCTSIRPHG